MDAYMRALRGAVKPGSVVVDIGTGTGVFAMLACQWGARRVYAIESDNVIQLAREFAKTNGYADRIEFIQDVSTRVTLSERADVIISDLRGVIPWFGQHIPSIVDARQRLLAPGGVLIPRRDTLWAAVVETPDAYRQLTGVWDANVSGLDMGAARRLITSNYLKARIVPDHLLVEPGHWATLDYATVESPDVMAEVEWTTVRAGTAHGLSVWFDATLAEGVGFSNAPDRPEALYGSAFFPFSSPIGIGLGDTIFATLQASLVGSEYVWRWDTRVVDGRDPEQVKAQFKQSNFLSMRPSPERFRNRGDSHVPELTVQGEVDRFILTCMDARTSLGEIAHQVRARFPNRFARWEEALAHVGELSRRYSR